MFVLLHSCKFRYTSFIAKRLNRRREGSFGGDAVQQSENMLQKEAYRTLKVDKAKVRNDQSVTIFFILSSQITLLPKYC